MNRVYLGVGSNIDRERNICAGLDALQRHYADLQLSPVYESEAIGFEGDPFFNLVVGMETGLPLDKFARYLRQLEYRMGRPANATRFSPRTLDIDILTFNDLSGTVDGIELPRPEITENAFVLKPLAELAPEAIHPALGVSYAELWSNYPAERQRLARVNFRWGGRVISGVDH